MRKLGILFLALVVIFFFFAGYYLFIVPSNKAGIDQYGMLVLEQLETAIQHKISADIEQYSTNLVPFFKAREKVKNRAREDDNVKRETNEIRQRFLLTFGVDSLNEVPDSLRRRRFGKETGQPENVTDTSKIWGQVGDIRNGWVNYDFYYHSDALQLTLPISRLMGDLQHSFPGDFYSAFLFLKTDNSTAITLYKSAGLPIGLTIPVDSLLPNSKGAFYPGITELHTGGQTYKLFYIPVTIDGLTFALCGVKDAAGYTQALDAIPEAFIYPLVIVLLVLVIALPLIKFYTIGPTEAISMGSMIGVGLSLLCGSMAITIIVIQVILLEDGDARMEIGMAHLSQQIDTSFRQELDTAFTQLQTIDQRRALAVRHWKKNPDDSTFDVSDSLIGLLRAEANRKDKVLPYLNFDRVAWVDSLGLQTVTATVDTGVTPLFLDVSTRGYYQDFVNNTCYRLPGLDTSMVSIEPVLSWTDGAYRVMLARRSACPGAFLTTLSMDLYSINRTVLPSGYGFCIIDNKGLVQAHSEPSRNLVENFLDESEDAPTLKAAINGRQTLSLTNTSLYGKQYGLQLTPIRGLPYYLVVFYDKGYILPVNLRILVFSLIGCVLTLLSCVLMTWLLLWLLFFRRQGRPRPLLFGPMDYLRVLQPMRKYTPAYSSGAILLEVYSGVLLTLALAGHYSRVINGIVVVLLLASPLLLTLALWNLARSARADERSPGDYLKSYCFLLQSLVIALGVLPAALYTWHAQNQEILQSVKREQLLKANQLQDRRTVLYQPLAQMDPSLPHDSLYTYWQYKTGIYSLFKDTLATTRDALPAPSPPLIFEDEYFQLTGDLGTINYDPQYIPVLKSLSSDRQWQWNALKDNDTLPFVYTQAPDVHLPGVGDLGRTGALAPPQRLMISSVLPKRYPYLGHPTQVFFLVLFIALLLVGMYRLVRRVATELFLQKWTKGKDLPAPPMVLPLVGEFKESMPADISIGQLSPDNDEEKMDEQENKVIAIVCSPSASGYFEWLFFKKCDPVEQYILYHFACTGFLNYKNVQPIDHLLRTGVLVNEHGQLDFFSPVFRAWLRMKVKEDMLDKTITRKSDWQRFRLPFLILLTAAAALLFLTQQDTLQRGVALVTALGTALGSLQGIFNKFGGQGAGDGK